MMRRRLAACCARDTRDYSIDFEEQERIMTYNGLESCILSSQSYDNESGTSRGDGCVTDYFDEDLDSSCSSSTNAFGSFSSLWTIMKKEDQAQDDSATSAAPKLSDEVSRKDKPEPDYRCTTTQSSDVETMKEKFAKLLLGEDVTGGTKGVCAALALSNAITSLSASVFGELWKLEPLPKERKDRWRGEMDWLLSPTNHMIELVPANQNGSNGRTLEIMTPQARADVNMNLPALRKLDSMLIETLDSMVDAEFWYSEVGNMEEGRSKNPGQSRRWWLPHPRVPKVGLSDLERRKLLNHGKLVYQVFKAARSINEHILAEMPVPNIIKDALPKSVKGSLGEELYRVLTSESLSVEEMVICLNVKSEHGVLQTINKLELAILVWKEKTSQQNSGKSPIRTSWSFMKDPLLELDKTESLINQAEILRQQLKNKHPNLPRTFLDATKIQYGKDVGQSILEAYSRVLASLAFRVLSRVGDILQEDVISNPNSPVAMSHLVGAKIPGISDSPVLDRVRHSLLHRLNSTDSGKSWNVNKPDYAFDFETRRDEDKSSSSVSVTPSRSRVLCIGKEACRGVF